MPRRDPTYNLDRGLYRWKQSLGLARKRPDGKGLGGIDVLCYGDSIMEGCAGYSYLWDNFPHMLKLALQDRLNPPDVLGGYGYLPHVSGSPEYLWPSISSTRTPNFFGDGAAYYYGTNAQKYLGTRGDPTLTWNVDAGRGTAFRHTSVAGNDDGHRVYYTIDGSAADAAVKRMMATQFQITGRWEYWAGTPIYDVSDGVAGPLTRAGGVVMTGNFLTPNAVGGLEQMTRWGMRFDPWDTAGTFYVPKTMNYNAKHIIQFSPQAGTHWHDGLLLYCDDYDCGVRVHNMGYSGTGAKMLASSSADANLLSAASFGLQSAQRPSFGYASGGAITWRYDFTSALTVDGTIVWKYMGAASGSEATRVAGRQYAVGDIVKDGASHKFQVYDAAYNQHGQDVGTTGVASIEGTNGKPALVWHTGGGQITVDGTCIWKIHGYSLDATNYNEWTWAPNTPVLKGSYMTPGNGYRYQCVGVIGGATSAKLVICEWITNDSRVTEAAAAVTLSNYQATAATFKTRYQAILTSLAAWPSKPSVMLLIPPMGDTAQASAGSDYPVIWRHFKKVMYELANENANVCVVDLDTWFGASQYNTGGAVRTSGAGSNDGLHYSDAFWNTAAQYVAGLLAP